MQQDEGDEGAEQIEGKSKSADAEVMNEDRMQYNSMQSNSSSLDNSNSL